MTTPLTWEIRPSTKYTLNELAGPGTLGGTVIAPVLSLLPELKDWLGINPRDPKASRITQGIRDTLLKTPEDMHLLNRGIWLDVDEIKTAGPHALTVTLTDPTRHGIPDGGHTLLTCLDVISELTETGEIARLNPAHFNLHIQSGLNLKKTLRQSETLNTGKQVQKTSLMDQNGFFDPIRKVLAGHRAEHAIRYYENDAGKFSIEQVVAIINMFNCERYDDKKHPNDYCRTKPSLIRYCEDFQSRPSPAKLIIQQLPDILELMDKICVRIPDAWESGGTRFGPVAKGYDPEERMDRPLKSRTLFTGEPYKYDIHFGMVYPMLAGFRANVRWNLENGQFTWRVDLDDLLDASIQDLVDTFKGYYRDTHKKKNGPKGVYNTITRDNPMTMRCMYDIVRNNVQSRVGRGRPVLAHA